MNQKTKRELLQDEAAAWRMVAEDRERHPTHWRHSMGLCLSTSIITEDDLNLDELEATRQHCNRVRKRMRYRINRHLQHDEVYAYDEPDEEAPDYVAQCVLHYDARTLACLWMAREAEDEARRA